MRHSTVEKQNINGVDLFFSVNKNQDSKKPILLYLHGGPGDSCIPLTQKFNSELEKRFNFINLEQRGAGLSYYKFENQKKLLIDDIVTDIYLFIKYILERFNQKKIILIGHSWGSVLAIKLIQKYPELFTKYIGIGQVVNMKKNIGLQQSFLNAKGVKEIELDYTNVDSLIKDSLYITKSIVKHGGSLFNETNYSKLIIPFILSKSYSIKDLLFRVKGSNQSIQCFWKELMEINFESIYSYPIPMYFFEGRHDYHVSSKLVEEYLTKVKSSTSLIWFEKSGHFPQWEESNKFNRLVIDLCE
ncbi:alpha/beta fold hydrolase [Enterococcus sp. AZ072]|uniref:alpha/beta fold hydrolase n=1 Tax=unclassified Enterococcus TaxID=2608891 RepID=UPI003D2C2487